MQEQVDGWLADQQLVVVLVVVVVVVVVVGVYMMNVQLSTCR